MDTLDAMQAAVSSTGEIVGRIEPDAMGRPSPCRDWDVGEVLNHMLGALWLSAALFADEPPRYAVAPGALPDDDLVGDDVPAAFKEAAEAAITAAHLEGTLDRMIETPAGTMPGTALGGIITLDVFVHGWDLARGAGHEASFDPALAGYLLGFAEQAIAPEIRTAGLIGPIVEVPVTAPVMDRLVGFLGRTP